MFVQSAHMQSRPIFLGFPAQLIFEIKQHSCGFKSELNLQKSEESWGPIYGQMLCLEVVALCFPQDCESLDQPVCWFRPTENRWIPLDSSGELGKIMLVRSWLSLEDSRNLAISIIWDRFLPFASHPWWSLLNPLLGQWDGAASKKVWWCKASGIRDKCCVQKDFILRPTTEGRRTDTCSSSFQNREKYYLDLCNPQEKFLKTPLSVV